MSLYRRFHDRFGLAGATLSVIALILALGGTALAAKGALTGKQKKEVEKIAKKYAGKPGAPGATGPAGPTGAPGAKGDNGAAGTNGTNGTDGTNGTSVTNTPLAKGSATCPEGGAEFKVGSGAATHACNGQTGFTETLPPGKTETGTWELSQFAVPTTAFPNATVSFPIPLSSAVKAVYLNKSETESEAETGGCKWTQGDKSAMPEAPAGTLCVFTQELERSPSASFLRIAAPNDPESEEEAGPTGAFIKFGLFGSSAEEAAEIEVYGVWAVTAPTTP